MKHKIILVVTILLASSVFLSANNNLSGTEKLLEKVRKISKEAFLKYDSNLFRKSIGLCERVLSAEPQNILAKYYLAYNQYRILIMPSKNSNENIFETYFNPAIDNVKSISEKKGYESETKTLLAAIYMMKLSKSQSEAPSISAKIYGLLGEAQGLDSLNPRVYLVKGVMLFHTPQMFGGSVPKALDNFNKAISIFESEKTNFIDWGYSETQAWKGQALTKLSRFDEAERTYKNALAAEPNFAWIKKVLLPGLVKIKSNENSQAAEDTVSAAEIKVIITGFENENGNVRIGLSSSEKNYKANEFYRRATVNIKNNSVEYVFDNIPFGTYAIKFYHDENENEKLDKNLFGIPKEEYGFSNNATGSFGPASFDDAKFTVNNKVITQVIKVN